ncbi:DMT family transporter [Phormidium sp. CCY1219]|uniref:DMT family transporter n=1 Tax=Phormidium sp. CCY1219 TaxID=2886104 RepID=UPI002D1EC055|nr:DMT family transporter [Phormidium sp. CCY1219]MEB3828105.1 DMT family transporter [Phormidium sp. CCY1219]
MLVWAWVSDWAIADYQGQLAALGGACLWALASVVYGQLGQKISPMALNLGKGAVAIALILVTVLLRDVLFSHLDPTRSPSVALSLAGDGSARAAVLLLLSGIIGIGLGDTVFFAAINHLGARRTLLLQTLAPPMTAVLARIFLTESLTSGAWGGVFLTLCGVAWVISERVPGNSSTPKHLMRGVSLGLLAALGQAVGAVLSRSALSDTSVDPLWSSLMRLCAGVLVLLLWIFGRKNARILQPLQSHRLLGAIAITAFFSTYLGIWLQQIGLKFAPAGIAQTLGATSPLFVLPVAIWMGERVSIRAIFGGLISVSGVALLFLLR